MRAKCRSFELRSALHFLQTIMARPNALRGALNSIRARPAGLPQQRLLSVSARCHANDKQTSFKSQLYESTQQRLQRERAEQERYAQYQTQSPGGRYAAMVFGMHARKPPPRGLESDN